MERGQFITHNGKEIYFIDYSNLKFEKDFLEAIHSTNEFRERVMASGKKDLLMLVDFTNSFVYGNAFSEIKRSGKLTQSITKRTAVIGITGAKKALLDIMNTITTLNVKPFDSLDDAMNWLIK